MKVRVEYLTCNMERETYVTGDFDVDDMEIEDGVLSLFKKNVPVAAFANWLSVRQIEE